MHSGKINAQWKNKTYSEFINGANTIGLIDIEENGYKLSKIGDFCLEYFKSLDIKSLTDLEDLKKQSSGQKSLFSEFPHLAKFLQLLYLQNPDFKQFITILINIDKKEITSKDIIDVLVLEYPNLFLNFFVKPREKEKVIEIFLKGNKEMLLNNYNHTIKDYGHYNFFFSFKRHLVHMGFLSKESKTYYGKTEDLDVNSDLWILGTDILL